MEILPELSVRKMVVGDGSKKLLLDGYIYPDLDYRECKLVLVQPVLVVAQPRLTATQHLSPVHGPGLNNTLITRGGGGALYTDSTNTQNVS